MLKVIFDLKNVFYIEIYDEYMIHQNLNKFTITSKYVSVVKLHHMFSIYINLILYSYEYDYLCLIQKIFIVTFCLLCVVQFICIHINKYSWTTKKKKNPIKNYIFLPKNCIHMCIYMLILKYVN